MSFPVLIAFCIKDFDSPIGDHFLKDYINTLEKIAKNMPPIDMFNDKEFNFERYMGAEQDDT